MARKSSAVRSSRRTGPGETLARRQVIAGPPWSSGRLLPLLVSLFLCGFPAHAAVPYSPAAVKAAFLFRFPGYMEWPPETLKASAFVIAVLGAADVAEQLQGLHGDRLVHDLPVQVRSVTAVREAWDAHMLYIGGGHAEAARIGIAALRSRPLLVITDEEKGLSSGSAVNFLTLDRRIRFEVSLQAVNQAGIDVDAEMLSVAARVLGAR